jgi:hypothetical protein
MKKIIFAVLMIVLALMAFGTPKNKTTRLVVKEVSLGKLPPGVNSVYHYSKDMRHFAYWAPNNGRGLRQSDYGNGIFFKEPPILKGHWVIDGVAQIESIENEKIAETVHTTSRFQANDDWSHYVFTARFGDTYDVYMDGILQGHGYTFVDDFNFSPDGKHLAYGARRGNDTLVVLDGQESKPYPGMSLNSLNFSPDSQHLYYIITPRKKDDWWSIPFLDQGVKFRVVLDGVVSKEYRAVPYMSIGFTRDMKHFTFEAKNSTDLLTVLDGKEIIGAHDGIAFSRDNKHMLYVKRNKKTKQDSVVIDGMLGKEYDKIEYANYSEKGMHIYYCAKQSGKWHLVMDGVPGVGMDDSFIIPEFSEDESVYAYTGKMNGKEVVVINGKVGQLYDDIWSLNLSSNGKHYIYTARQGKRFFLIQDGIKTRLENIRTSQFEIPIDLTLSPDGTREAYIIDKTDGLEYLVVDGKAGKGYAPYVKTVTHHFGAELIDPVFSPDSQHVAYYAKQKNKVMVVVDGQESPMYDKFIKALLEPVVVFDTPTRFRTLAIRNNELYRVEMELVEE